jgi:hypothetical protein
MKMKPIILLSLAGLAFGQLPWPHPPQNQVKPLGNSWGIYQDYGGSPYVHNGDDIMTTPLCPVTVIKNGYVKAIWNSGTLYRGISVADSAGAALCYGFQYYHVDSIKVQVGDTVYVGDTIAKVVTWTVAGFNHNHFSRNRNSGVTWSSYGGFIKNPLSLMTPDNDSMVPVFSNAVTGQRFAVCVNDRSTYLNPDSIYGSVDFICRVEDKINHRTWWCAPYKLVYSIRDTFFNNVVPPRLAFQFSESLDSYSTPQVRTVYKDDATCNSNCNYDSLARRLYFIFTNTDTDSLIEGTDSVNCWNTTTVPDGYYWVKVTASDEFGNSRIDSMRVRVKNLVGIEENENLTGTTPLRITPNPVRDRIEFTFNPGKEHRAKSIELKIYDVTGSLIRSFTLGPMPSALSWGLTDQAGRPVPCGAYFLEAADVRIKFTVIR